MVIEAPAQVHRTGLRGRRPCHDDEVQCAEGQLPERFAREALDAVAVHCAPRHPPRYRQSEARVRLIIGTAKHGEEPVG